MLAAQDAVRRWKKPVVRAKLGVSQPALDRWLKGGQGISAANARALASLVGRTLDDLLGTVPDRQTNTHGLTAEPSDSAPVSGVLMTGVDVGLAALRERSEAGKSFPNLALFLAVNERRRPEKRREWGLPTIIAAAGGLAGDEDFPPEEWEVVLDEIEEISARLRRQSGSFGVVRKPPSP